MLRYGTIALAFLCSLWVSASAASPTDTVIKVVPGYLHGCALTAQGAVYCWGMERVNGRTENTSIAHRVEGLPKAAALASGHVNSCILDATEAAWCWGVDLQASVLAKRAVLAGPKQVAGLPPAAMIVSGYLHTCAVTRQDGSVWCWGANAAGELGDGSTADRAEPVRAGDITRATSVSAGVNNTCATVESGDVYCWGSDLQTGDGQIVKSMAPTRVALDQRLHKIVNGRNFFFGLTGVQGVLCFGSNIMNQLGNKELGKIYSQTSPRNLTRVSDIAAGGFFGCALLPDGSVACWGHVPSADHFNFEGKDPEPVTGISNAVSLGVGLATVCAIDASGRTLCWGNNQTGQTGSGRTSDFEPVPVKVQGLPAAEPVTPTVAELSAPSQRTQSQASMLAVNRAFASPPKNRKPARPGAISRLLADAIAPKWWRDAVRRDFKSWPH